MIPTVYPTISPNGNFEYDYPHSNALLQFRLKLKRCKMHNAARHPTKHEVINDVKMFPTVYPSKFMTLSNQISSELECIVIKRQRNIRNIAISSRSNFFPIIPSKISW